MHVEHFESHPSRYQHWILKVDGEIATLKMDIQEEEDQSAYLHVYPYDDGMHMFPAPLLMQFEQGSASLELKSMFYSPFFGLEGSEIQDNQGKSFIYFTNSIV